MSSTEIYKAGRRSSCHKRCITEQVMKVIDISQVIPVTPFSKGSNIDYWIHQLQEELKTLSILKHSLIKQNIVGGY